MHKPDGEVAAYIGLGSNLGDRREYILQAKKRIGELEGVREGRFSCLYESDPVGFTDQERFLNGVLEIHTTLTPEGLLKQLQKIELDLNRVRRRRWGPRTIDLDILFFGRCLMDGDDLTIPHERLHERAFVLIPLMEMVPDLVHPRTGKSIREHAAALGEADRGSLSKDQGAGGCS